MSGVATDNAGAVAVSEPRSPATGQETADLLARAVLGDRSCLPAIRALLADGDRGLAHRDFYGSSAEWLRQTIVQQAAGKNVMAQEAVVQKLKAVEAELAGPDPTPIERLLAERASLCWMLVNWYENSILNSDGMSVAQANYHQLKIDKAHARFLSAVRTLAQVRKLALPTLQVNIARNQVNVAETRS